MANRPELLIEKWFPVETIGAESMRERGASSALPPLYFLHVWWARRPLTASRAAILASVLPSWGPEWPQQLRKQFPTERSYHQWFLRLCGIWGDQVAGRKLVQYARDQGKNIPNPYTHKRAFTFTPDSDLTTTLGDLLEHTWGSRQLSILDSFAGGGSIPFEARRYGFLTYANDLNTVASIILRATVDYPFRFGPELAADIRRYGKLWADRVQAELRPFFASSDEYVGAVGTAYFWIRTVACPYTGKIIPLSPNWWLQKGSDPLAVEPLYPADASEARFRLIRGSAISQVQPDNGTVRGGKGISPWSKNQPVDGSYIKAEAKAGRLRQQLYAVAIKRSGGFAFRAPNEADELALTAAHEALARKAPAWDAKGLIPRESRYIGPSDRLENYGVLTFDRLFAPRQLLALTTSIEELRTVSALVDKELPTERAAAVRTYLAFALDKAADYNSMQCHWNPKRRVIANTFSLHDFRPRWNFTEFDAAGNLLPWVVEQVADAYEGIAKLAQLEAPSLQRPMLSARAPLHLSKSSASDLRHIESGSLTCVCIDPPYYDNVIYSECSDFFYVWMKRTAGDLYNGWFEEELSNKDDEAVANASRFASIGPKKKMNELAAADYTRKMYAAFQEARRVLREDGVLTVMFTHKKVEAWDTLATSLIGAGFSIRSSWPVHTESEHSTHQAKKNAAQSTIILTCRKRESRPVAIWWDDLKGTVRRTAREAATSFERQGIRGVDLYIATFGPTLAILSENWPVLTSEVDPKTGEPRPLRPEVALDLARAEVVDLRKQDLLLGRTVHFDRTTDWYLMAWDAFRAIEFPADEARKLALALDLDLERDVIRLKRLVRKKQSTVVLNGPAERRKKDMVDSDKKSFDCWIDAAHTAMLLYAEDGAKAAEHFLHSAGLRNDGSFKALIQALLNAIPRTRIKGKFVRPEAEVLEAMRLAFFDDLQVPAEEEIKIEPTQMTLTLTGEESGLGEDSEDGEEEEEEDSE